MTKSGSAITSKSNSSLRIETTHVGPTAEGVAKRLYQYQKDDEDFSGDGGRN